MEIKFGNGSILVGASLDDNGGVLKIQTGGRGTIGELFPKDFGDNETLLCKMHFSNLESVDVVIRRLENVKKIMIKNGFNYDE